MAPQLGAPSYCSGREGRQSHWPSCPNKIIYCQVVHAPAIWTGWQNILLSKILKGFQVWFVLIKSTTISSYSGAYCNRHPFLIVSGWQD